MDRKDPGSCVSQRIGTVTQIQKKKQAKFIELIVYSETRGLTSERELA